METIMSVSPFFSVITPTLQRDSLIRACRSLDEQTCDDWEHIVMVDTHQANYDLWDQLDPDEGLGKRKILLCEHPHADFGNTCRHNAWPFSKGKFLVMLDDDNYISDPSVFFDMKLALEKIPNDFMFAVFPILRHGRIFFDTNPRSCHTDTANIISRREVGRWPARPEYTADGFWVEMMKEKYQFATFADFRPIIVMESSGLGI